MTRNTTTHRAESARWVPAALVALSLVPAVMGSLRLGELFGGAIAGAFPGGGVLAHDLALSAAWVINLALAERVIRRSRIRGSSRRTPAFATAARPR